jgi:hypothetical protein
MTKSFRAPGTHWTIINALLIVIFASSAFLVQEPEPGDFDSPAVGIAFSVAAIVLFPLATIIWLHFAKAPLRAPAWNRSPFGYSDPLQSVFLAPWWGFAALIGVFSLVFRFGMVYIWTAVGWGGVFVGCLITRFLAFRLYRNRIVPI